MNLVPTEPNVLILLDNYLHYQSQRLSLNSMKAYTTCINGLRDVMEDNPYNRDMPMHSWLIRCADEYLNTLETGRLSTWQQKKSIIVNFMGWIHTQGYSDRRLTVGAVFKNREISAQKEQEWQQKRQNTRVSEDEMRRLLTILRRESPRDYIMFLLLFNLALRSDDIVGLQRKNFYLNDKGEPYVSIMGKAERRKNKAANVQLDPPSLYTLIMTYMDEMGLTSQEDYVLTVYLDKKNPLDGVSKRPYPKAQLWRDVSSITINILGRKITSHFFRRSKVTLLRLKGIELDRICKLTRMSARTLINNYDCENNKHDLGEHTIL